MRALLLALLVAAPGHVVAVHAVQAPTSTGTGRQQPVSVQASLMAPTVVAGSTVVLQLRIRTAGDRPQIQPLTGLPDGLYVVDTRSADHRQFSLPGGTHRFVSRDYVLRARRAGRFRIPPVTVVLNGQRYQTQPLSLTVVQGEGQTASARKEVTLRVWLNTDTAYVGEQVTYSAEAAFGDQVQLRLWRAPEYDAPNPTGFWVQDLPGSPTSGSRVIGSNLYEVQTFRRALFPIASGLQIVPPAHLSYELRNEYLSAPETRVVRSDTLRLVVLPVPAAGRPPGFTGAVGRYTVAAELEPDDVSTGQAVMLRMTVKGVGNLKALPAPALPPVSGVEVYPPSEDASVNAPDGRVQGTKRFAWVLIPGRAGHLQIPAIRYPFFDPAAKRFRTASTAPLSLTVRPGALAPAAPRPRAAQFHAIKLEPALPPLRWTRSPWFAALQTLPLWALVGMLLVRRRRRGDRRPARRTLTRRRRQLIEDLRSPMRMKDTAFFRALDRALRTWLGERLQTNVGGPPETLMTRLQANGVPKDTARGMVELLARLKRAAYEPAPPSPESRRVYLQAADRLLEAVDRQAPRPGGRRAAGSTSLAVMMLVLPVIVGPQMPAAAPRSDFDRGVATFQSHDAVGAIAAFRRYTAARPADPAGWYDLGNAYQTAGERGPAIRAWLEALRRAPRDPDVLNNLHVAQADPALVDRVRPLPPLATDETLLLASLCWLLGGAALLLFLRRQRAYLATVGTVLVVAAFLFGGMVAVRRMSPPLAVVTGPDAALRATPNLRDNPLLPLDPGAGLHIAERHGGWWRVRTLDGRRGWVEADMLTELSR